jgi:hypothetical protein
MRPPQAGSEEGSALVGRDDHDVALGNDDSGVACRRDGNKPFVFAGQLDSVFSTKWLLAIGWGVPATLFAAISMIEIQSISVIGSIM